MPTFDTGVSSYIKGVATVENYFPVDNKGNPDLSCEQCKFFMVRMNRCALNYELCNYPQKYLGTHCPLYFPEE